MSFLKSFDQWLTFDTNPVYALLHESIYTQGPATRWAAQRVRDMPAFRDTFDPVLAVQEVRRRRDEAAGSARVADMSRSAQGREVMFTGEMVFPFMFEDLAGLRPLQGCAEALAQKSDWTQLYSTQQLARNEVPVAAARWETAAGPGIRRGGGVLT